MKFFLSLAVLMSFCLSSCFLTDERVEGNGNIKTENRTVGSFSSIDVGGNINVYITQGAAAPVRIETDENLLPLVEITTKGNRLVVRPRDDYNLDPSREIDVYVSSDHFSYIGVSGASHVYGQSKITSSEKMKVEATGASGVEIDLNAPVIETHISGASSAQLRGETKDLVLEGSGASSLKCFDLKAENVEVKISGASEAQTFASVKLDARASGASHVKYKGSPTVNSNTSGASGVSKAD